MSIKRTFAAMAGKLGGAYIGERILPHGPRVIFFHGVTSLPIVDKIPQACQMPVKQFENIICYLIGKNYKFISADDLYEAITGNRKLTQRDILITFDDGYKNNYTVAAPILAKHKIPFVVFICADLIERGERIAPYYHAATLFDKNISKIELTSISKQYNLSTIADRLNAYYDSFGILVTSSENTVRVMVEELKSTLGDTELSMLLEKHNSEDLMNWSEVVDIQNYGGTIASHCMQHSVLNPQQSNKEIDYQLHNSKQLIIKNIGRCDYFSFPNGNRASVSDYAEQKAASMYNLCFGVNGKSIRSLNNRTFISRINVCEDIDVFKTQFSILSAI